MTENKHIVTMVTMAFVCVVAVAAIFNMGGSAGPTVNYINSPFSTEQAAHQAPYEEQLAVEPVIQRPAEVVVDVPAGDVVHIHESGDVHQHPLDPKGSITEEYYAELWSKVSGYSAGVYCESHGPVRVSVKEGVIGYKALDQLFEYDRETGAVGLSSYHKDVTSCHRKSSDQWRDIAKDFLKGIKKGQS